jgi:hypothetical protein
MTENNVPPLAVVPAVPGVTFTRLGDGAVGHVVAWCIEERDDSHRACVVFQHVSPAQMHLLYVSEGTVTFS